MNSMSSFMQHKERKGKRERESERGYMEES